MKRGVIELNRIELATLKSNFPINLVEGTPLAVKLNSAFIVLDHQDVQNVEETGELFKITVSEEEIEQILDEIGIPSPNDKEELKSLRLKFRNLLLAMRQD